MLDDTNCTTDYHRSLGRDIRKTILSMDQHQKEQCLTKIQAQVTLLKRSHNPDILKYVTTLLSGKEPRKGISKERNGLP